MPIEGIVACGGLPFQNRLLMQLTADITGREVRVSASRQAPALGSAMFGAVAAGAAAGGYDTITDAAACMAHLGPDVVSRQRSPTGAHGTRGTPSTASCTTACPGRDSVMRRLRALQDGARERPSVRRHGRRMSMKPFGDRPPGS